MWPQFDFKKTQSGYRTFLTGPSELLVLLPKPDPLGFSLEGRDGEWVIKDNDFRTFSTKEKAAFFHIETTLIRQALDGLIPVRARVQDRTCRWPRVLTKTSAVEIFDLLKRWLGVSEELRADFLEAVVGKETGDVFEFPSWGGHIVTFEVSSKGPDFRGHPMTASGLSSLLVSRAYLEILALYQEASTEDFSVTPPSPVPTPSLEVIQEDDGDFDGLEEMLSKKI